MQAIVETSFDVVYLATVITIGILMIRGSRGNRQFRLFGMMAVLLGAGDAFHLIPRAVALCTTGLENFTVPLGLGKWITSITMTVFYVLLYYVWRLRYHIQGRGGTTAAICGLAADDPVHHASEWVAERNSSPLLGYLPQHSVCSAGAAYDCLVLSERQAA